MSNTKTHIESELVDVIDEVIQYRVSVKTKVEYVDLLLNETFIKISNVVGKGVSGKDDVRSNSLRHLLSVGEFAKTLKKVNTLAGTLMEFCTSLDKESIKPLLIELNDWMAYLDQLDLSMGRVLSEDEFIGELESIEARVNKWLRYVSSL